MENYHMKQNDKLRLLIEEVALTQKKKQKKVQEIHSSYKQMYAYKPSISSQMSSMKDKKYVQKIKKQHHLNKQQTEKCMTLGFAQRLLPENDNHLKKQIYLFKCKERAFKTLIEQHLQQFMESVLIFGLNRIQRSLTRQNKRLIKIQHTIENNRQDQSLETKSVFFRKVHESKLKKNYGSNDQNSMVKSKHSNQVLSNITRMGEYTNKHKDSGIKTSTNMEKHWGKTNEENDYRQMMLEVQEIHRQCDILIEENGKLNIDYEEISRTYKKLKEENMSLKRMNEEIVLRGNNETQRNKGQIKDNQVENMKKSLRDKQQQCYQIKREMMEKEVYVQSLKRQINQKKKKQGELIAKIHFNDMMIEQKETRINQLEKMERIKMEQYGKQIQRLEEQFKMYKQSVQNNIILETMEKQQNNIKIEFSDNSFKSKYTFEQKTNYNNQIVELQTKLYEKQLQNTTLQIQLQKLKKQLNQSIKTFELMQNKNKGLEQQNISLHFQYKKYEQKVVKNNSKFEFAIAQKFAKEIKSLKNQRSSFLQQNETLTKDAKLLLQQIQMLKKNNQSFIQNKKIQSKQQLQFLQQIQMLKRQKNQFLNNFQLIKQSNNEFQKQISTLRIQNNLLISDLQRLKKQNFFLSQNNNELKLSCSKFQCASQQQQNKNNQLQKQNKLLIALNKQLFDGNRKQQGNNISESNAFETKGTQSLINILQQSNPSSNDFNTISQNFQNEVSHSFGFGGLDNLSKVNMTQKDYKEQIKSYQQTIVAMRNTIVDLKQQRKLYEQSFNQIQQLRCELHSCKQSESRFKEWMAEAGKPSGTKQESREWHMQYLLKAFAYISSLRALLDQTKKNNEIQLGELEIGQFSYQPEDEEDVEEIRRQLNDVRGENEFLTTHVLALEETLLQFKEENDNLQQVRELCKGQIKEIRGKINRIKEIFSQCGQKTINSNMEGKNIQQIFIILEIQRKKIDKK